MRHLPGGPAASSNSGVAGYPRAQKEKNKNALHYIKTYLLHTKQKQKTQQYTVPQFLRLEIFFTFGDFIDYKNIYVQFFLTVIKQ